MLLIFVAVNLVISLGVHKEPDIVCDGGSASFNAQALYDFYVLSMQWPFSVCEHLGVNAGVSCRSPPAVFTIRGFWPAAKHGPSPTCCAAANRSIEEFSLSQIGDFTPELRYSWPDLSNKNSASQLWKSQWQKHGSCTGLSPRDYFKHVLRISRRYGFRKTLQASGVLTATGSAREYSVVQKAVNEAAQGKSVQMRCIVWRGEVILHALQVCIDKESYATRDCPSQCLPGPTPCCRRGTRIRVPYGRNDPSVQSNITGDPEQTSMPVERMPGDWMRVISGTLVIAILTGACFLSLHYCVRRRLDTAESVLPGEQYQRIGG